MSYRYADVTARAGVLEPEGIVEIKFRKAKVLAMMERLDDTYRTLKAATTDSSLSSESVAKAKSDLAAREKLLLPMYGQIALQFADLHDRANRMKAKGTIREALDWQTSREYFYWRLRRRLAEESIVQQLVKADSDLSRAEALRVLSTLVDQEGADEAVANHLEQDSANVLEAVSQVRKAKVAKDVQKLALNDKAALIEGLKAAFGDSSELQSVSDSRESQEEAK